MKSISIFREHNASTQIAHRTQILISLLITILPILISPNLLAMDYPDAEQIKSISANWVCQWCPYQDQGESAGSVSVGAGYVSNDSYKHGDYTGLDEQGLYAIANAQYTSRSSQGNVIRAQADNLGLDSRSVKIEGGQAGSLYGKFNYKQLPKLNSDTARTPYSGDSNFSLPSGWVTGADTQNMPQLAAAMHNQDIDTQRDIISVQGEYRQSPALSYQFAFERNSKQGKRTAGLAIGTSFGSAKSVILAIPVDYVTNLGEAKINYQQSSWQVALAYQFSDFNNGNHAVQWQNAFDTAGVTPQGQASLEPDNNMQKLALQASYQFSPWTYSSALLAVGRMEQNDSFLPYTVNTTLSPAALPADSLNGKINTIDAAINFYSRINARFQVSANYRQNELNNNTDRYTFSYVTADTPPPPSVTPRANFPYSFRKQQLQLQGQFQLSQQEFSVGTQSTIFDRTYQEVDTTTENALRASYSNSQFTDLEAKITGEHSQRDASRYTVVSEIQPPENPLLYKYNMADRKRDKLGVSLNYVPAQSPLELGFIIDAAKDDYNKSELGLLESIEKNYSVTVGYTFSPALQTTVDYTLTTIESTQDGRQSFSSATWQAKNNDHIDALHLALHYQWIPKLLKFAVEYEYAKSMGDTNVSTAADFPQLRTERQTILLSGEYQINDKSTLTAFYRFEHYDESDWATDNVYADTIPNVLSLGEITPSYNIGVIGAAVRYLF